MKKQISLYTAIQGEYELTTRDKWEIHNLLTHRCRRHTKDEIMGRLNYITAQPAYPVYERVTKETYNGASRWELCARQDYDQDIRDIRNLLLGK